VQDADHRAGRGATPSAPHPRARRLSGHALLATYLVAPYAMSEAMRWTGVPAVYDIVARYSAVPLVFSLYGRNLPFVAALLGNYMLWMPLAFMAFRRYGRPHALFVGRSPTMSLLALVVAVFIAQALFARPMSPVALAWASSWPWIDAVLSFDAACALVIAMASVALAVALQTAAAYPLRVLRGGRAP
jgi:hypothetical protein